MHRLEDIIDPKELEFKFVLSSGPGGQNVNKVATAVQLRFNLRDSPSLPPFLQERLLRNLTTRLTKKGEILIHVNTSRSQAYNKELALKRLFTLLNKALEEKKKRVPTLPSLADKTKRLESKKQRSEIKKFRKPLKGED